MDQFLAELNAAQREAAMLVDGPILILAGAGTGKTKTITTRLAYLLSQGIDPGSTLTLTFTNKAAREMRDRALQMIGQQTLHPPGLYTFHKFGLLFLRFHMDRLERRNNFVIIDTDDKKRILKQFTPESLQIKAVASEISHCKNSLIGPDEAMAQTEGLDAVLKKRYQKMAEIYGQYQSYLQSNNLVDFDDLLALPHQILKENESLRQDISRRYQYVMVDEYQDTNELQLRLLKQLCDTHENLCVVGDDDQSIYGWRGANVQNILGFSQLFKKTAVIKLEENYRSTQTILKAANELIAHNRQRHDKKLISTLGEGEAIALMESHDENEESTAIARRIGRLIEGGVRPGEIAILFRINALSRSLEEGLNKARIPYKLVDSVGFYERLEIKDAIAYLRLMVNPHDDFSLRRVINKPKRGVGKATLEKIEKAAFEAGQTLFGYLEQTPPDELAVVAGKKSGQLLHQLADAIKELSQLASEGTYALVDRFESLIGLRKLYLEAEEIERVQNIDELYGLLRDFGIQNPHLPLEEFLAESALSSDQDALGGEVISMMTIHAAKGLEFEHLFVIGLEDGFFPLLGDGTDSEEERRLGYVAFTRAKKSLTLCTARSRFFRGRRQEMIKSRFLTEAGLIKGSLTLDDSSAIKKGDLIKHKLFGMGRVTAATKAGREYKLTINFGGTSRDILSSFVERI